MPLRYQIENVTKTYARTVLANDRINLEIRTGEVFGLLGPNGAGKTTLVQQMVGLLRPDDGRIFYDEYPVRPGDAWLKRHVAYLSQRPLALLDLTVREAITYTGQLRGLSPSAARTQAGSLIEELDLGSCADRLVAKLSGGQHRLVALGSALIGDASTLVLDEPTNELDPEMRRSAWNALRERCHQRGATVVLVTHNALEAEQVLSRLAVLMNGQVIACGTPGEIKSKVDGRVRVELTFRQPPDGRAPSGWAPGHGLLAHLQALGTVVQSAPNQVVLAAPRPEARHLIDEVLQVVSLDELDDFRVLTPTLEDVYLQVAARDRRAS